MSSPLFVGVGPVLVDQFVHCDVLPDDDDVPGPGTKRLAESPEHMARVRKYWVEGWAAETQVGGPVLVALRQAKALGAEVKFLGSIGDDDVGDVISDQLVLDGFSPASLAVQAGRRSGSAIVWIDRHGERSILFDSGSLDPLEATSIRPLCDEAADVIHIDSREHDAAKALAQWGNAAGIPVHYDVDPWKPWTPELLSFADVAQVSWREVEHGDFGSTLADVACALRKKYALSLAVVTNKAQGLAAADDSGELHEVAAFPVDSFDTVGAGDVFAGSLEIARCQGKPVEQALRFAAAASAILTTRLGNRDLATAGDIERLLETTPSQKA